MTELSQTEAGFSEAEYRFAMGRFATGVAVVTTAAAGGVAGITINSLTSVSLRPPILLWCLDDRAARYAFFAQADRFGVSILSADQQALSDRFARKAAPMADEAMIETLADAPVMKGALAQLVCRAIDRRTLGDHLVIAGQVEAVRAQAGEALGYFASGYTTIAGG